jgi:cytochrome c2
MVAAADVAEGEKIFRRCAACHAVEPGVNKVGPSLHGIVGRDIASVEGFTYSDALKGADGDWTFDNLSAWIENPRAFAAGNKMGFPGIKKEADRANLIGYLQTLGN